MRTPIAIVLLAGLATFALSPNVATAADGFDPRCDAPENWQDDFNIRKLMEFGWPEWFLACHPDMPPMWPDEPVPGSADVANGRRADMPAAPDTSSPGTLWDQPVADPLDNIVNSGNNILNFGGFGDSANFRVADDFFLDPALITDPRCQFEITEIRYSESNPEPAPADRFVLEIWNDGGGRPSGVGAGDLAAGPFTADTATFVGVDNFNNFDVYELTWNFAPPQVLSPGTYWLSVSEENNGGTISFDAATNIYGVPSGSFPVQFCSTCTGLWTLNTSNTDSLDFDIDGSVVCPDVEGPAGVGGFEAGEVRMIDSQALAIVPDSGLPLRGVLFGLATAVVIAGGAAWRRRRR